MNGTRATARVTNHRPVSLCSLEQGAGQEYPARPSSGGPR